MAGSFTADGQGNITNGIMDQHFATGSSSNVSFTGTYSLDTTNTGPMMFIGPTLGTPLFFQVAVPASGTIRFIKNGTAGDQGTGVIRKVTSATSSHDRLACRDSGLSAHPATMLPVIAMLRQAPSQPATPAVGPVASRTPTTTASWPPRSPFTGSFVAIDPVTGRGTAILTVTGGATTNYSFYPVSSNELDHAEY